MRCRHREPNNAAEASDKVGISSAETAAPTLGLQSTRKALLSTTYLPLVPPDATMLGDKVIDVGGHKLHRTEWQGTTRDDPKHHRMVSVEGADGERFVSQRAYTAAQVADGPQANERFDRWQTLFDAVLSRHGSKADLERRACAQARVLKRGQQRSQLLASELNGCARR